MTLFAFGDRNESAGCWRLLVEREFASSVLADVHPAGSSHLRAMLTRGQQLPDVLLTLSTVGFDRLLASRLAQVLEQVLWLRVPARRSKNSRAVPITSTFSATAPTMNWFTDTPSAAVPHGDFGR